MPSARFGSLVIGFDESVLEPRPWTIEQAAWGIDLAAEVPHGPVLEPSSSCRWGLRSLSSVRPSC